MFCAEKKLKLSDQSIKDKTNSEPLRKSVIDHERDSDYISQTDFTESNEDFSLAPIYRKSFASDVNFSKQFDLTDSHQLSSGYSSLFSSSLSSSPRKSHNRSPKKRKLDDRPGDENAFSTSDSFASPVKLRKNDPSECRKRAKLVLREKSSSENVILSSTPIRDENKNKLWGKFRSLHPEKFNIGKSLDDAEPINKPSILPRTSGPSIDYGSSFELSLDSTSFAENTNIPSGLEQLWKGSLARQTSSEPLAVALKTQPIETATKSQEQKLSSNLISPTRKYFNGRLRLDICGKLFKENNLALDKILNHLSDIDILSLSHVSKDYKRMIKSNKSWENKRRNYLNAHRTDLENKLPGSKPIVLSKPVAPKNRKRAFADSNVNHSMELRSKPVTPPVSPSTKRFQDIQKIKQSFTGSLRKCPKCGNPAKISTISIRSSPRKKKKTRGILKVSSRGQGRVQKQNKTFLSKPSIDSCTLNDQLYVTFPTLDDYSGSESTLSSPASPVSPNSEDSGTSGNESGRETQTLEFGSCSKVNCHFKFCVKCNCKYHPRRLCNDFSVASPTRTYTSKSSIACTRQSTKRLKRLTYDF